MSAVPNSGFNYPKIRAGVIISTSTEGLSLSYREQGCQFDCPPDALPSLQKLLETLKTGDISVDALSRQHPDVEASLPDILEELDHLGLLEETPKSPDGVISGRQLYRDVVRSTDAIIASKAQSSYLASMGETKPNKRLLIGYALEYFHLVRMAPSVIAPVLSKSLPRGVEKGLRDFYASEMNHEEMLAQSLASVGISETDLQKTIPLQSTLSLCVSLGAYANQHPLSFLAALRLFETPYPEFNTTFQDACVQCGLPKGFWGPILHHSDINDEYDHGDVARDLMSLIPCVSQEDRLVTLKHASVLAEMVINQEQEMLVYYGNPDLPLPRIFD